MKRLKELTLFKVLVFVVVSVGFIGAINNAVAKPAKSSSNNSEIVIKAAGSSKGGSLLGKHRISVGFVGAINNAAAKPTTSSSNNSEIVIKAGSPIVDSLLGIRRGGSRDHAVEWNFDDLKAEHNAIKQLRKERGAKLDSTLNAKNSAERFAKEIAKEKVRFSTILAQKKAAKTVAEVLTATNDVAAGPDVLVLYDYRPDDVYGKLGKAYAIMLSNLLGHFNATVTLLPIDAYLSGGVNSFPVTFYLGSYSGNPVNPNFLMDVKVTANKVVWLKNNLEQLTQWGDQNGFFAQQFGFYFNGLQGMNANPTASNTAPGFYDAVLYKNQSLVKYYAYDAATNTIFGDPDAGKTTISNPAVALTPVMISNTKTGAVIPYVVQSNNFWYFADIPFSYIGPRDRYLVFADILHDILGSTHAEQHRAMIRLEDMSYLTDPTTVKTLSDYLNLNNIPFSMAVVPHYMDPLGVYNNGKPQNIPLAKARNLKTAVTYGLTKGGSVVQHGYTHQYSNVKNPHSGVSADDFEFWDTTINAPIAGETTSTVTTMINAGKTELTKAGYTPFTWEVPHYQASPVAYRAISAIYKTAYERATYYTAEVPNLNPANPTRDIAAGQFFPYVIEHDYYGRRVLPENLGNIEYDIHTIDPFSTINYTWQDLSLNAQYALVVRDGFASFFFHPFWLETFPSSPNVTGYADLQQLVNSITSLQYQWIGANSLVP